MKKGIKTLLLAFVLLLFVAGCGKDASEKKNMILNEDNPYVVAKPGEYDSKDTAVITKVSELTKSITFYNYELGKSYTLSYDSATKLSDKYGTAISVGQLSQGEIVDIKFLKSGKLLTNLTKNAEAFSLSNVTGFSTDTSTKVFKYLNDSYKLNNNTVIINRDKIISVDELSDIDVVTISGMDTAIYSISVNCGHGYLKLKGTKNLVGGYLEIGEKKIERIDGDTSILVSEGSYDVKVSKGRTEELRKIEIISGEETVLDLSDVEIVEERTGTVYFDANPSSASVYIDGKLVDASKLQTLGYGMHKLVASADGYETLSRYFNVGEDNATLEVYLEKIPQKETETESVDSSKTGGYYVFVNSPVGVEVTVDGIYLGRAQISWEKKAGTHTITLSKNGYVSRTYTVVIENTAENVFYTFDDLVLETTTSGNDSTTSE